MNADAPIPRWAGRLAGLIIAAGMVVRARTFLAGHGLWSDEVRLAINVALRSFIGLQRPMAWDQTAPVPFLWASKITLLVGGVHERTLRLLPFLAGVGLIVVAWRLARRLLPVEGALLATALTAASPLLVYYSSEFKPYSMDALISVLVGLATVRVIARPEDRRAWWWLAAGGALSVLSSSSAPLVLAGAGLALLASPGVRALPRVWLRLPALASLWLGLFVACYLRWYRHTAASDFMVRSWTPHYLTPGSPRLWWRAWYIGKEVVGRSLFYPHISSGQAPSLVVASVIVLAAAGVVMVWRRQGAWAAALCAGPWVATLAASALRQYPIWPRLVVFETPFLMILLAAGACGLVDLVPAGARRWAFAAASLLLLVPAGLIAARTLLKPIVRNDARRLIRTHLTERAPGEPIYVSGPAIPLWAYYSTDWSRPDTLRLRWLARMAQSTGPAFSNRPRRNAPIGREGWDLRREGSAGTELLGIGTGKEYHFIPPFPTAEPDSGWARNEAERLEAEPGPRAWLLFSELGEGDEHRLLQALEAKRGHLLKEWHVTGASLYYYEFATPPDSATGGTGATP
jgi:hypothetical protein